MEPSRERTMSPYTPGSGRVQPPPGGLGSVARLRGRPAQLSMTAHGESSMRTERASVCPLDCPDTCSLTVTVEDDRVVQIRGSRANPYTAGVICTKVARDHP